MPAVVFETPLGCTSFSFPLLPLDKSLQVIALLELDGVDLCIADGGRDVRSESVLADAEGLGARHRRLCQDLGLQIHDVFAHLGASVSDRPVNTPDPRKRMQNRTTFKAYLEYAKACASPGITISPGLTERGHEQGAFRRAVDELAWYCEEAASLELAVSVEPHLGSVVKDVGDAVRLCNLVSGLSLTLDHSHFIAAGVPAEAVDSLFSFARHAHLRQARRGLLQCPVADGSLDIRATLRAAATAGFTGTFALEFIHSQAWGMNQLDVLSETIRLRDEVRGAIS
jgi:sugar phosphate isomerase/epimerase